MIELEIHPLCGLFPRLTGPAFDELVESIKAVGLKSPIAMYEGKILDGRNRYLACKATKVVPDTVDVSPADPVAYVLATNLYRRHLTVGQRALIAAKLKEQYSNDGKVTTGISKRDKAGKAVGISGKSVDMARDVIESGIPELIKAVENSDIAISKASAIAGMDPKDQRATLAEYAERKSIKNKPNDDMLAKPRKSSKPKAPKESNTLRALKLLWLRADNTERADFLLWTKEHTKE